MAASGTVFLMESTIDDAINPEPPNTTTADGFKRFNSNATDKGRPAFGPVPGTSNNGALSRPAAAAPAKISVKPSPDPTYTVPLVPEKVRCDNWAAVSKRS